ncbi:ABC transporter ATP-binding protein [Litoribacter ruber]|uniref:ABC transporter ATP-binding protein n=1 Tax=Litoribacter ruber TaxID=702568 RepID=UPI001BDADE36|nr:ABC transporter ATP-binding protein [Litoribacter ruber]MBT0811184.1 ABC transporter ATP-binding protein [Litoribacter ruber]
MSYLKIDNISKQYDEKNIALRQVGFALKKGEVVSVLGESGSGKSTLLRIIAGLEIQDEGRVYLEDEKILNPAEKLVAGYDEIKLIHQQYKLYLNSTVEENIGRPLLLYDKDYRRERVEEILQMLNLHAFRHKLPKQLSGGQQQKVAIGRALSIEPEVLLLDEPFSSLDTIQKRELIEELRHIFEDSDMTVIFVTHDLDDALLMSKKLFILKDGELVQKGAPRDIFRKPKNLYTAQLFSHLNPIPGNGEAFIRPSDVKIEKVDGRLEAEIISAQYLIHYTQLTVRLKDSDVIWKVEDQNRLYQKGDYIGLSFQEENIISFSPQ